MTEIEKDACNAFVWVIENFFSSKIFQDYSDHVKEMLSIFKSLYANMSIKVPFFHSQLDHFPEILRDLSGTLL